jgi:PAP_fibrillin
LASVARDFPDVEVEWPPLSGTWRVVYTTAADLYSLQWFPIAPWLATVTKIHQVFDGPRVTNVIDIGPPSVLLQAMSPLKQFTSFNSLVVDHQWRIQVITRASPYGDNKNRVGLTFEKVQIQPLRLAGQDTSDTGWSSMVRQALEPLLRFNIPNPMSSSSSAQGYFDFTFVDQDFLVIRQNASFGGGIIVYVKVDSLNS